MFYCERHTVESHLEITTTIAISCTYYDWCDVCEGTGQSCCTAADLASCNDHNVCTTVSRSRSLSSKQNPRRNGSLWLNNITQKLTNHIIIISTCRIHAPFLYPQQSLVKMCPSLAMIVMFVPLTHAIPLLDACLPLKFATITLYHKTPVHTRTAPPETP